MDGMLGSLAPPERTRRRERMTRKTKAFARADIIWEPWEPTLTHITGAAEAVHRKELKAIKNGEVQK